jgi:hypothetical protein
VDEIRISLAGDAFYAVARPHEEDTIEAQYSSLERLEETPHGCYEGWVYMGFENEDEDGELAEVAIERVRCRRCRPEPL